MILKTPTSKWNLTGLGVQKCIVLLESYNGLDLQYCLQNQSILMENNIKVLENISPNTNC